MLNTDKVRRVVKAKYGLTAPTLSPFKPFENPTGFELTMYNNLALSGIDWEPSYNLFMVGQTDPFSMPDATDMQLPKISLPIFTGNKVDPKSTGSKFALGAKDFIKQHGMSIVNTGIDMLGSSFNNVERSKAVDTTFKALDTLSTYIPQLKPINFALKGINSLGGKNARLFSVNLNTAKLVGGSYLGSMTDITNAAQNSGKKYGLFSSGKRKRDERAMDRAEHDLNIMTGIANEASDMRAMSGQSINYTRYMTDINGGLDLRYMRAAKSGMKLLDKIDFVKLKRTINSFINLDIKEIEWEPIIDDIELYKDGGSLPELWEPIIDDIADYWEPIIDDIELYREGGKLDLQSIYDYYKDYDLTGINLMHDNSARTEGNTIYVNSNESAIHELWHLLSQNKPNEKYKEFYDNLNDDRIVELGGDLEFVKRFENDPGHFYLPSELEARIKAAKYMSNGQNYTEEFFLNLRSDENKWGDNMRDLLRMFNNKNLVKIFNLKKGGTIEEDLETPEIEETNQKNLIPEGALHKNKHHMEHTEGLTQKGIPVVDNNGEQLAEIELDEIIFTLEVTKKLEELYKEGTDEAAIEAGKLLVKEILFNTDDRTGLISKCEKGGKL